jgi:hypothetical protein
MLTKFEQACEELNLTPQGRALLKSLYMQIFIHEIWTSEEEALLRAVERLNQVKSSKDSNNNSNK